MRVIEKLIEADRESPKRILVVGDGMTDVYVNGRLEPTCQEGCPKFIEESLVLVPGGAANAVRSIEHWSAKKIFLGDTRFGPTKTRHMVGDRCVFRSDNDTIAFDFTLARKEALHVLKDWAPDAVLISDYDKGFMSPKFIREVIAHCNRFCIPCVADVKREPAVYDGSLLKCNKEYARRFREELQTGGCAAYVITDGCRLPMLVRRDRETVRGGLDSLPPVKCVNHVGAGDCFAAHLTLVLAYGPASLFSLEHAARIAHSAGRVYVQYPYNRPPTPAEIAKDLSLSSAP